MWSNQAADPLAWLITCYLLVRGGLETLCFLLATLPPDGDVYRFVCAVLSAGAAARFDFGSASLVCNWLLALGLFAGGVLLWYRPSLCMRVVWLVCVMTIVNACAQVAGDLETHVAYGRPLDETISLMVGCVGRAVAAVYVLRVVRHGFRGTRRVVGLVGGTILILGAFSTLGAAFRAQFYYRDLTDSPWVWAALFLKAPTLSVAWLGAGVWLLLSRRKAIVAVAAMMLWVHTVAAIAFWLPVLSGHWVFRSSEFRWIYEVVRSAAAPLTALVFLWLAWRYKGMLDLDEAVCSSCGYLLHGLPTDGHHCPECGTFFARPGAASPAAHSAPANRDQA